MRLCVTALFLFALLGLSAAETFSVAAGGTVRGQCRFHAGGHRKKFCRNDCSKKEDVLAEMTSDSVRNGRYSIEYWRHPDSRVMDVSIRDVTSADSGEYTCVMERFLVTSRRTFTVNVTSPSTAAPGSETQTKQNLYYLLLLIVIPVVLVIVFVIYKRIKKHNDYGLSENKKGIQENVYGPESGDCTYQSLSPDTRDQDQVYCSLDPPPSHYCNQ